MRRFHVMPLFLFLAIALMLSPNTKAKEGWRYVPGDNNNRQANNNIDLNVEFHKRYPEKFEDDIAPDQDISKVILTPQQKHQALVWGLSDDQEKRYVLLMQNRSGIYFKNTNLTPVEILCINARTDKERAYYAALDAKQEFQKGAKILAFASAYSNAAATLTKELKLPMLRPFNTSRYSPYSYKPIGLKNNDKLMLFVKLKNKNSIKPIVAYLLAKIALNPTIRLNIYFVDHDANKAKITDWTKSQNIPTEMVNKKEITLNFGEKFSFYQENNLKKTPALILIRGSKAIQIDTGRF